MAMVSVMVNSSKGVGYFACFYAFH